MLTLPTLKESVYQNYEKLAAPLREDFDEGQIERIFKVLCDMPMLEIDLCVIGQLNDETDVLQRVKMPSTKDDWIQIHQNEVFIVVYFAEISRIFLKNSMKTLLPSQFYFRNTHCRRISIDMFIVRLKIVSDPIK